MARATIVDLAGTSLPVATAEDLVVLKAIAWRDRDKSDIEELIRRHVSEIDFVRVRATLSRMFDVLDEPERMAAFEVHLQKVLTDLGEP